MKLEAVTLEKIKNRITVSVEPVCTVPRRPMPDRIGVLQK
jgi:hypothetical protein